jgi:hypothetical protein
VFAQGWPEHVLERRRTRYFPAMARRMPELRKAFLYRRAFLTARSARFDMALLGAVLAASRRSSIPLALAFPYLRDLRRHSMRARPLGPRSLAVAGADAAADLLVLASLLEGSLRYGSVVL